MWEFLGTVWKPLGEWASAREERKKETRLAQIERDKDKLAKNAEALREGRSADAEWELESVRNSGWKDEMWSIWFVVIATASFVPGLQEYASDGLEQLSNYPEWFRWMFATVVLAPFGVRVWRRIG